MSDTARPRATQADGSQKGRKASKETRRQQLIEATIDSLAKRGYSETTLADIADGAEMSRGIVNFHFESKEKLLVATLQFMTEEYAGHWEATLEKAGVRPSDQLQALVAADFDRKICTRRKLAAWCAFWGEAKSRPTYKALCGAQDRTYQVTMQSIVEILKQEGGYSYDSAALTLAMCAMLEGLWFRLMMDDGLTREAAHQSAGSFLASVFPKHFAETAPTQERPT
ncbi:TetR family transcriptional regulator C-terminal domain-containing protein [Hoeflea marina]|nr:TetR family transcriptional regulator C-terminal domain-containing protein [Hoeflea marina]